MCFNSVIISLFKCGDPSLLGLEKSCNNSSNVFVIPRAETNVLLPEMSRYFPLHISCGVVPPR